MRETVTRTFAKMVADCVVYVDGKIAKKSYAIPANITGNPQAKRFLERNVKSGEIIVTIEELKRAEELRGMPEKLFIKLARIVPERSKETRNDITKNVIGFRGEMVYMTPDYKIERMTVTFGKKDKQNEVMKYYVPDNCSPIKIENITECETLYAMDEKTFYENSRPMVDHQHYKP